MTDSCAMEGIQFGRILAGHVHAPVVYFVKLLFGDRPAVKIGTSTRLKRRIETISYAATLSDVLLLIPGGYEVEAACHQRFRQYRIRDELFRLEGELKAFAVPPPGPVAMLTADAAAVLTICEALDVGIYGELSLDALRRRVGRSGIKPVGQRADGSFTYTRADLAGLARDSRRKGPSS
jgi:hypothetical protein